MHLVCDSYVTHKLAKVHAWIAKNPHIHLHFTPTFGSWLNQVERGVASLGPTREPSD